MVNLEDNAEEEGSCVDIGDIVFRGRALDSVDDDDEEATTQHLRNAPGSNQMANLDRGKEGGVFSSSHIGDIVFGGRKPDSNGDNVASLAAKNSSNEIANIEARNGEDGRCSSHIGDVVFTGRTPSDSKDDSVSFASLAAAAASWAANKRSNQMANIEESKREGFCSSNIGDIVFGRRTPDLRDNSVGAGSLTAATTPSATNNNSRTKKKWIVIEAIILAAFLTIAIGGVIAGRRRSKQQSSISEATSFDDTENELPWWACLTKESCVDQAKLLGYADKDIRYGDFSYDEIYGCFKNEGVIYWGIGGTDAQNFSTDFSGQHKRLWCCDVNPNPNKCIDNVCDSAIVQSSLSSSPSSSSSITKTAGPSK
jgi:hypothetical protein